MRDRAELTAAALLLLAALAGVAAIVVYIVTDDTQLLGITFGLAFLGMIVGCLVFARRFAALGRRGWVGACIAIPAAALALASWPDADGVSVRLVIASAILFGFVAATAARLMRGLPVAAETAVATGRAHDLRSAA